jgi:hypothetical protein
MSGAVFLLVHGQAAGGLPAWQAAFAAVAAHCAKGLLIAFFALTLLGFAVGLVSGKRVRGRSLELITWFFWWIAVIVATTIG